MRPGDYFVTRTGGWFGWCIRKLTFSPVNHAGIYMGGGLTIEAKPKGVTHGMISDYSEAVGSTIELTQYQRNCIMGFASQCLGRGYNFLDIVVQGIVRLFKWHAPKWTLKRVSDNKHLQCAQLVDYCYQMAGVQLFPDGRPDGLVAPSDLYNLIEKS